MSGAAEWLAVDLTAQQLTLWQPGGRRDRFPVATGAAPPCERRGSGGTPRGWHCVRARIGEGAARRTVFAGRRPTGEVWSRALARTQPRRDWILTRILWLSGVEPGWNRLGTVDTMRRYIYIHGAPDDEPLGVPVSHGCIRMDHADLEEVFDRTSAGTPVWIGHAPPDRPWPGSCGSTGRGLPPAGGRGRG